MQNENAKKENTPSAQDAAAASGVSVAKVAAAYAAAGLCALPAVRALKRPAVRGGWRAYSSLEKRPDPAALFKDAPDADAVCIVCGAASGNLECIDFDNGAELFSKWAMLVSMRDASIPPRLVIEKSQSGGIHVVYRCEGKVEGNMKLAQGMRGGALKTLIETRGEGGLFLCAPSPGYTLLQGRLRELGVLSAAERATLLACARELDERPAASPGAGALAAAGAESAPAATRTSESGGAGILPGDDFCARGDVRPYLEKALWRHVADATGKNGAPNELWRRPGKDNGHSAAFDGTVFYVFSTNAAPFEAGRGYNAFQVYALLEHNGDFSAAARALAALGYGDGRGAQSAAAAAAPAAAPKSAALAETEKRRGKLPRRRTVRQLSAAFPKLRESVIHGLLRRGETMNVIAPPKTGKSWLVFDLALAVATGGEWFGFKCEKGKVLIIDNELHGETSAARIPRIIRARGVDYDAVADDIVVENQRGSLSSIDDLEGEIDELRAYGFKLVIVDAFYRALPRGTSENDNGAVTYLYNTIDKYAEALGCAFVLIHHTTKGNQAQKTVTDIGAGAGAQSRAVDTHVVLRNHKESGCVVMNAAVRSFAPVKPVCLRWNWPVWDRDDTLDPTELEGTPSPTRGGGRGGSSRGGVQ